MAKNRSMAIKNAKAKKAAGLQASLDAQNEMCATRYVPRNTSVIWNLSYKPYSITR